ncbi:protein kinase [Solihabitans fulvus]|uniref:non-specific serine/threonine protein kinase n=1 Tax=Solihabitans fulvus TaxID=1892852 RepID=A0A5B2XWF9_9PSEU|nr:protein kinase [Solihabitans fulvus]KAA2267179.1 protein kinase [Solihabitans fulvus]
MSIEGGGAVGGLRPLGEGPIATVYVGRSADTGVEVAVKMFYDRIDRDTAAWLDRERAALDSVRSVRSVLPVDGVVEHPDGRSGVRMELCRGSLAGLLDAFAGPLAVGDVLVVGSAVATALAAAHQVGVLHGGVTPQNVLYRRSSEVCLADFGLALRERFPRDPMHAVEYTAPETLRDDTRSVASDLYGLGAVLYTALTGAPPFPRRTGQQPGERILQVLREQVPPIQADGVPSELSTVVGQLLAKDPADRPQDAASVAELFQHLSRVAAVPVAEPEPDPAAETTEPARTIDAAEPADDGQDDFDFDDFAEATAPAAALDTRFLPDQPTVPAMPIVPPIAPAVPRRTLLHTFSATPPRQGGSARTRWRPAVLVGIGAVVVGLTAVPLIAGRGGPATPPAPAAVGVPTQSSDQPATSSGPTQVINLELAAPTDEGTAVQLDWKADGDLDFAVVVAGEQINTMVLVANRQHSMRVPIDPTRRYCFQVRATNGQQTYKTKPLPIRGAQCSS